MNAARLNNTSTTVRCGGSPRSNPTRSPAARNWCRTRKSDRYIELHVFRLAVATRRARRSCSEQAGETPEPDRRRKRQPLLRQGSERERAGLQDKAAPAGWQPSCTRPAVT